MGSPRLRPLCATLRGGGGWHERWRPSLSWCDLGFRLGRFWWRWGLRRSKLPNWRQLHRCGRSRRWGGAVLALQGAAFSALFDFLQVYFWGLGKILFWRVHDCCLLWRLPVSSHCLVSMLPLHSAIASARLRSVLAAESQRWGLVPQGIQFLCTFFPDSWSLFKFLTEMFALDARFIGVTKIFSCIL